MSNESQDIAEQHLAGALRYVVALETELGKKMTERLRKMIITAFLKGAVEGHATGLTRGAKLLDLEE